MAQRNPSIAWRSADSPPPGVPIAGPSGSAVGGNWVAANELHVSIHDLGFRQSVVAVERLRTYHGRPASLSEHIVRWRRTLDHLAIAAVVDEAAIAERIDGLQRQNERWCQQVGDFGITMLATPGWNPAAAVRPTEMMHFNPLDHAKIARHRATGQPLVITDVQQPSARSWPRDIKVRCRLHYYLADRLAHQIDPAAIGLLVDADGSVTETSVASLAICRDGVIFSPPPEQVLPGVTQHLVEQVAHQAGIAWTYTTLFPADVRQADEVWLMGTDGGLWFINRADGMLIGQGQPGAIYRHVLAGFDAATELFQMD